MKIICFFYVTPFIMVGTSRDLSELLQVYIFLKRTGRDLSLPPKTKTPPRINLDGVLSLFKAELVG